MPQVSIVVPCYNSASFLPTCVDSLTRQSLRDIEILLVDDGSTDDTLVLARTLAASDSRLAILTQVHTGPGAARNRGIEAARAPWVMFVDSDDEAAPDACAVLVRRAEATSADVVLGRMGGRFGSRAARVRALYTGGISMGVYGKLFRRSFLQSQAIRFPPAIYIEDRHFLLQCLIAEATVASCEDVVYHRHLRPDSSMHRVGAKHIADVTAAYELDVTLLGTAGLLPECGFHAVRATLIVDRYLARMIPAGDAGLRAALARELTRQEDLFRALPLTWPRRLQLRAALAWLKATTR